MNSDYDWYLVTFLLFLMKQSAYENSIEHLSFNVNVFVWLYFRQLFILEDYLHT